MDVDLCGCGFCREKRLRSKNSRTQKTCSLVTQSNVAVWRPAGQHLFALFLPQLVISLFLPVLCDDALFRRIPSVLRAIREFQSTPSEELYETVLNMDMPAVLDAADALGEQSRRSLFLEPRPGAIFGSRALHQPTYRIEPPCAG